MEDKLSDVLAEFGLVAVASVRMTGGLESAVWRVDTTSGRVAARRHAARDTTSALISSELTWLAELADSDAALAPRPMCRADRVFAPTVETDAAGQAVALWSVLEWVEGSPLERLPTAAEARAIGEMIAALHNRAREWTSPVGFDRPAYDASLFRRAASDLFSNLADKLIDDDRNTVDVALSRACATLDQLWLEGRDIGVIHADLHDGNLMWADGAAWPTAIDFSRCGMAPLVLDVAMAQHYLTPDLAANLLGGYQCVTTRPIDQTALPALRYLAAVENLAILSGFADEAANVVAELPWLTEQASGLLA